MPLQRPTTRVFMLCYGFLNKRSPLAVQRFPAQMSPLPPCGSANSQSTSQSMMPFPTQPSKTHYPYTTGKRHYSSAFLCSSGLMFIIKNTFLDLKTNVHNLYTSARPRNIRWVLVFLGQVRSLRNIRWVLMFLNQVRKLRNIRWVLMFLGQAPNLLIPPVFSFFPALLCPATSSPCTGHPSSLLPTHRPPQLPAPHINELSSSSRSQSGMTSSLFQVIVYFNFHLLFFTIIYYIVLIFFLFVGHFVEGVPEVDVNGGFDAS
jgi:hypothetical protein